MDTTPTPTPTIPDSTALGTIVPSLNPDDKGSPRALLQARVMAADANGKGAALRLQGPGPMEVTVMVEMEPSVWDWLQKLPAGRPSLAGTGAVYFPVLAAADPAGIVRVQVPGPALNRPYGAAFDILHPKLGPYVGALLAQHAAGN